MNYCAGFVNLFRLTLLFLVLGASSSAAFAQFTDNFNDNTVNTARWGTDFTSGNGRLLEQNQRLDFIVSAPSGSNDLSERPWIGPLPNSTNWEAIVEVHNSFAASSPGQWASMELELLSPVSLGEAIYIEFYTAPAATGAGAVDHGFRVSVESDVVIAEEYDQTASFTNALLRLAYDASSKVLTISYDRDDAGSAFGWEAIATIGLGGSGGGLANRNWNLSPTQNFGLGLAGYGSHASIQAGDVWADNLSLRIFTPPVPNPTSLITDNFNDNSADPSKWAADLFTGGAHLTEQNQRLDYTVASPGNKYDLIYRPWVGQLPIDFDWEATIDAHNAQIPSGSQWTSLGMQLRSPTAISSAESIFLEFYAMPGNGGTDRYVDTSFQSNAVTTASNQRVVNTTDVSLKLAYDSVGRIVTVSLDSDGPSGPLSWEPMGSYGLRGTLGGLLSRNWNLSTGNNFSLTLLGFSGGSILTAGQAWLDNFNLRIQQPAPPRLGIVRDGANVRITWPATFTGFNLQSRESLALGDWANVALTPAVSGTNFESVLPIGQQNQLFRLLK